MLLLAVAFPLIACGTDDGDCARTGLPESVCSGQVEGGDGGQGVCLEATFAAIHGVISAPVCANGACHAGPAAVGAGNLDLSGTPQEVFDRLVGVSTSDAQGRGRFPVRVDPTSPDTSYFLLMIESDNPEGSSRGRMPPGGQLRDCEIEAIRAWIEAGAAND